MSNHIVIGANYGDEGKGRTVDYLVKNELAKGNNPIVVRFSGSNNAGHTVVSDGKRNVFSMLGSGSFNNVPTFLSKHVFVDISVLLSELESFTDLCPSYDSIVYIDPRCRVILPYDIAINRLKEVKRSKELVKHGSTGNGHNEAYVRSETDPICISDIKLPTTFTSLVDAYYNFCEVYKEYDQYFDSLDASTKILIDHLLEKRSYKMVEQHLREVFNSPNVVIGRPNLSDYSCVFEGSQGLLLDEYIGKFPHVTRGRTSSINVIDICRDHNIEVDDIWYVSRPYLSRHGSDPYFHDNSEKVLSEFNIVDATNIHNLWQDSLKFDFLNVTSLVQRINYDMSTLEYNFNVNKHIVFTCLDQIKSDVTYIRTDQIGNHRIYRSDNFKHSMKTLFVNVLKFDSIKTFDREYN